METLVNYIKQLGDPDQLILLLKSLFSGHLSYLFLFAVIFAETGLLIGFILPGDSFLFTVGVVAGAGELNILLINIILIAAAILGDSVNYSLGRFIGQNAYARPHSVFFNKKHLEKTKKFYEKHGVKTIIYARFLPVVRTFAPFVAGVAQMNYKEFLTYNIIGGVGWVIIMTMLGYFLGDVPWIRANFEKVIIGIILTSFIPPIYEMLKKGEKPTLEP